MDSILIQNLINYSKYHLCLNELDEIYIRSKLLEITFEKDFIENEGSINVRNLQCPDKVINPIIDSLIKDNKIQEAQKEEYLCKILDVVSLKPSEIDFSFNKIYKENKLKAFQWLHKYCELNSYIKRSDINKNIKWIAENTKGKIEITINLSKPEKSLNDVKKAFEVKPKYPKCVICPENVGYVGHSTFRQNLRGVYLTLNSEKWFWQFSPYEYFNEHGICINSKHTPMKVDGNTITRLLDFIDFIPDYFIGCNAGLPIIGGSILAHDHYQGGNYLLPMMKASNKWKFISPDYLNVEIGVLDWYNNVIQLRSNGRFALEGLAKYIIESWKRYFDIENNILAYDENPHNSITVIAYKENNKYVVDLILRNNITSIKYPEGIFHAHPEYYNIKSEAIGLIEAAGLFILPARLQRQLNIISDILSNKYYNIEDLEQDMQIHKEMIERLLLKYSNNNDKNYAQLIVKEEVARICECILDNTAVFKNNECGIKGFKRFLKSLNIVEVK